MKKANFTVSYESDEEIFQFELWLRQQLDVTDFRLLPDAKDLYNTDPNYKKMWKQLKKDKNALYDYIKLKTQ